MLSLESLHADLLAGDLRVSSRIVELALPPMLRLVERQVPGLHGGSHEEACMDALFDYLRAPASYDAERAGLLTWLVVKARFRALTMVRGQTRRTSYEQAALDEQRLLAGDGDGERDVLVALELGRVVEAHWRDLCQSPEEEEIFLLMAAGERHGSAYLEALDWPPTPENHARVAEIRERLRGRVRRLKPKLAAEGDR